MRGDNFRDHNMPRTNETKTSIRKERKKNKANESAESSSQPQMGYSDIVRLCVRRDNKTVHRICKKGHYLQDNPRFASVRRYEKELHDDLPYPASEATKKEIFKAAYLKRCHEMRDAKWVKTIAKCQSGQKGMFASAA